MSTLDRIFDPEIVEDPYLHFAHLRVHDPVHLVEGTSTYLVTRHDLVHEIVADHERFSSNSNAFLHLGSDGVARLRDALGDEPSPELDALSIIATADPPVHARQRRVLSGVFSRRSVESRADEFRAVVDEALDPAVADGRVEWMAQVAEPVPAVIVGRIMGMPDGAATFLRETGFATVEQISGFVEDARRVELRDLMTHLGPVGAEYERVRGGGEADPDTVLAACVDAVETGELDDLEAIAALMLVVSAGTESTTSLLGVGARLLATDPDLQERVRREPSLVPTFVEEACRVEPPFRGHYRHVTRDTELGGVRLPAGSRLVLVWPAANRDPDAFDSPDRIDLGRSAPRSHVGFGWGIHLCLGAPLARLEARLTFERLLARTSRVELEHDAELSHHRSLMIRRLVHLPLRLEP